MVIKVINSSNRRNVATVKIYPNPVIDNLNVVLDSDIKGKVTIQVIDIQGKVAIFKVFEKTNFNQRFIIDLNALSKGTYLIRIQEDLALPVVRKIVH